MRSGKCKIVAFMLVACLSAPAYAFFPLAIPVVASTVLHVVGAIGLYYAMRDDSVASVDTAGNIKRPSKAQWIDLTMEPPVIKKDNVTAKMDRNTLQTIADKLNPDGTKKYPTVHDALYDKKLPDHLPPTINSKIGDIVSSPYGNVKINGKGTPTMVYNDSRANTTVWPENSTYFTIYSDYNALSPGMMYYINFQFTKDTGETPTDVLKTPSQIASTLANDGLSGEVKSAYQAELDKMFQDPSYIPFFSDDTTGLPYYPPTKNVATPAQVDSYNAKGAASDAAASAAASAAGAAQAAQNSATQAGNAYIASGGNLATGQGGDASLYQKYLDAQAAAAAAQAAADKLSAEQAADDADSAIATPSAPGTYGSDLTYDFSGRLNTFFTDMRASPLFSLPSAMLGSIPSGGSSVFHLNFGRFGSIDYDLSSSFGTGLNVLKFFVLFAFSVASLRIILLRGGS